MKDLMDIIPMDIGVKLTRHHDRTPEQCLGCIKKSCNLCPDSEIESEFFKTATKKKQER